MKYFFRQLGIILLLLLDKLQASIWIKDVKSYGPSQATNGVECLSAMSKLYFKDSSLSRDKILVVSFTQNLSIPADNIQKSYLRWVHEAFLNGEMKK